MSANDAREILSNLGEASRQQILEQLRSGPKSVSLLVRATGLKQPNVSNHLAKMRKRGIVEAQKRGRQVIYSLADPLVSIMLHAVSAAEPAATEISPEQIAAWRERYYAAARSGAETDAAEVIGECLRRRLPLQDIHVEIIQRSLERIGEDYVAGEITEADEHIATELTQRVLGHASAFVPSKPANGRVAVVGCVAGNRHSLGPRMIADLLIHEGWTVLFTGADTPTPSFLDVVRRNRPQAVVLSCAVAECAEAALDEVEGLREVRWGRQGWPFVIAVGGGYVNCEPEAAQAWGADFTAHDARGLSDKLTDLLPTVSWRAWG